MMNERQNGKIASLFLLARVRSGSYFGALSMSMMGILLESLPFVAIYFITMEVLQATGTGRATNSTIIWTWAGFTLASLVFSMVFTLIGGYRAHQSAFQLIYGLRCRILEHLGVLPMGYFAMVSTGEIQKQMENGMFKIEQLLAHSIPNLIGAGPLLLALLLSLFIMDFRLASAVLLPVFVAFAIQAITFSSKKNRQIAVGLSDRLGAMNRWFNEYLRGISIVKVFGGKSGSFKNLGDSISDYTDYMIGFTRRSSIPFSLFKILMLSLISFVLPVATLLLSLYGGEARLVLTILMFLIIIPCLYGPILELMRLSAEVQEAGVAIEQMKALFSTEPLAEVRSPQIPKRFDVVFSAVSFSYQEAGSPFRQWALKDVSFRAETGCVTALVGPSGGGKTTTGQLLCRFWDVQAGTITIGGIDIREISLETLMDMVAFVFQDTFLFSSSVFDNIAMNRPVTRAQVEEAAKAAMCHAFIMNLPDGYETLLGDGGSHLSGGEAQRIAIARAILKDSPIIVLDEATAYTDADNESLIQQALSKLLTGKTVLIIAHRLATIRHAKQIIVMKEGHIVEDGSHLALIKRQGLYEKLWKIQNESVAWMMKGSTARKESKTDENAI